jgi:hypothetical protein
LTTRRPALRGGIILCLFSDLATCATRVRQCGAPKESRSASG